MKKLRYREYNWIFGNYFHCTSLGRVKFPWTDDTDTGHVQEQKQKCQKDDQWCRLELVGPVGYVAQWRLTARLTRVDLVPFTNDDAPVFAFS